MTDSSKDMTPDSESLAHPDVTASLDAAGYITDAVYTWNFFNYQAPIHLSYIARLNGHSAPSTDEAFTYCDLGSGNGVTVNLLADALPHGQFWGIDINPDHTRNARAFSDAAGLSNVTHLNQSFETRSENELPQFDFITLHGVYSWVSPEIQAQIVAFVDRHLKPGGLLYLSHNALPGWAPITPLWAMMRDATLGEGLSSIERARKGIAYLRFLHDQKATYFEKNPAAGEHLKRLVKGGLDYFIHEMCHDWFTPCYFDDVANAFRTSGLVYAGTAAIHRNRDRNIIPGRFRKYVAESNDRQAQESRRSLLRNEMFRRDIYIRSQTPPSSAIGSGLDHFMLGPHRGQSDIKTDAKTGERKLSFTGPVFDTIIPLAQTGTNSIGDIRTQLPGPDDVAIEAVQDLIASRQFIPMAKASHAGDTPQGVRYRIASEINRLYLTRRLPQDGKCYLASPVTGSGFRVNFQTGMMILSLDGRTEDEAKTWALDYVQSLSSDTLERLKIRTNEPDAEKVSRAFGNFRERYLHRLIRLGILELIES